MNTESSSLSKIERHKNFVIDFLYWTIIVACIFIGGKYLLPVLLPFILAYGIAYLLNKMICRIAGESHRKRVALSILLTIAFYMIGGSLLALIGLEVFSGIKQLISFFPAVCDHFIFPILEDSFAWIENLFQSADLATLEFLENNAAGILQALNDGVISITNGILSTATSLISFVPSAFMKMVITIIATVFLTIDYETIRSFLLRFIPQKQQGLLKEAKDYLEGTLLKCIASYRRNFLDYLFGTLDWPNVYKSPVFNDDCSYHCLFRHSSHPGNRQRTDSVGNYRRYQRRFNNGGQRHLSICCNHHHKERDRAKAGRETSWPAPNAGISCYAHRS